jgi:hypothetical protein
MSKTTGLNLTNHAIKFCLFGSLGAVSVALLSWDEVSRISSAASLAKQVIHQPMDFIAVDRGTEEEPAISVSRVNPDPSYPYECLLFLPYRQAFSYSADCREKIPCSLDNTFYCSGEASRLQRVAAFLGEHDCHRLLPAFFEVLPRVPLQYSRERWRMETAVR